MIWIVFYLQAMGNASFVELGRMGVALFGTFQFK